MKTIKVWNAKRAGGRITIYGLDQDGASIRVPNVDNIKPEDGKVVATNKNGDRFHLEL